MISESPFPRVRSHSGAPKKEETSMRIVATTALVFLFFQAGQGPAQQQNQNLPAVIEGLVLQAASGEPIAKAQVTLTRVVSNPTAILTTPPPAPIPQISPILTDAAGK